MRRKNPHEPVMVNEVIEFLRLKKGYKVLDATVGCGGHAEAILEKIGPQGFLIGVDLDEKSLDIARNRLHKYGKIYRLIHANFRDLDNIFTNLGIDKIDAALFDLGFSSRQIEDPNRWFSFKRDGSLDMRMDLSGRLSAYDIVNKARREDLERIIRDFGEERYFKRITKSILEQRGKQPIKSTLELSEIIRKAVGGKYGFQRIHPATRTFQALRIAVNRELDNLDEALGKVLGFLRLGRRVGVISFHSLEDRIVKTRFKEFEKAARGLIITKKPLTATDEEVRRNPRSRSAKLRIFERRG